jgi:hypothetical protein
VIAKIAVDALRLDQMKPLQTTHDFDQSYDAENNQVQLISSNYREKLPRDKVSQLPIQRFFCFSILLFSLS